jgi:hypothetical protein
MSSWGGVCPGNNESAGRHKSRHTTRGNPWFRASLTECAWAASRKNGSAFQAQYDRLKPHVGHKRALVAVAHSLARAIYYVLSKREAYRQPDAEVLSEVKRQRIIRHHTRRLGRLGCWLDKDTLTPLQQWYVTHCIPEIDTSEPKRRGRKPKAEKNAGDPKAATTGCVPGMDSAQTKRRGGKPTKPAAEQGAGEQPAGTAATRAPSEQKMSNEPTGSPAKPRRRSRKSAQTDGSA